MTCDDETTTYVYPEVKVVIGSPGPAGLRGETGSPGPAGAAGAQGPSGVGVPIGGTTGQVLVKLSNNPYDVGWANATVTPTPPVDPIPPVGTTIVPPALPDQTLYWQFLQEWAPYIDTYIQNETNGDFKQLKVYYDGEMCRYRLADQYSNTALYYPMADRCNDAYADYYVRPNNGAITGFWLFPTGLVEGYIRRGLTQNLISLRY